MDELSVLVWAPRGRDTALAAQLLQLNGHTAIAVEDPEQIAELVGRAGCAIVTEEALQPEMRDILVEALRDQPAWSDFPLILFAPRGTGNFVEALRAASVLGNVTVLERPVQTRTLLSAVSAALRGRRRQYEARTAIQRRDEFLAMLGHELRNPLAAITLAIEDLGRQCGDAGARSREILQRQSHHLSRLVEDLLDVTRVTMGKITLKTTPLDLGKLLGRCVQGAQTGAQKRGTQLVFDGPQRGAIVDGDPVRLEEVFTNLLSNAIKYSPDNARVEVRLRAGTTCVVDVVDQGVGITPEMLPRVFDLFAQADATLDRSAGGLGIGLTVVKSLVELHRGTVTATSAGKGRGSTFTVELPRSSQKYETTDDLAVAPAVSGLRVLVIDDNADVLELTSMALESEGCEVVTADNGLVGLELLRSRPFDVAFVDIGLPGIDGYEIARQSRAAGIDARMVAVSGYGQDRDRKKALDAGFDLHLTKPVTVDQMVRATRA